MGLFSILREILILINALFKRHNNRIVFYHDIHNDKEQPNTQESTPFSLFSEHFNIARDLGYQFVTNIPEPGRNLMICFDDGYRGIWDHREFFIKNNLKAVVFVISGFIGKPGYLTGEEIRLLHRTGLFKFGFHTNSHINLDKINNQSILNEEILCSREIVMSLTDSSGDYFCLPRGRYSIQLLDYLSDNNIMYIFTSVPGSNIEHYKKIQLLPRSICQSLSPFAFRAILKGGDNILRPYYKRKHFTGND